MLSTRVSAGVISGNITDAVTGEKLPSASLFVNPGDKGFATDVNGYFSINLPDGKYDLKVTYVGYTPMSDSIEIKGPSQLEIMLQPNSYALSEVVVASREGVGISSVSKIDRSAMEHLQPTSFTDLLELIPGNISKDPDMTGANTINLRETGNIGATGTLVSNDDYSISSLGTLFVIDGSPVSTEANIQNVGTMADATSPHYSRNITNKGVDMRTISTDNIESVEIVRGIPGAEYGNLSSGMINIKRINRATPFTARLKVDEFSKLFFLGKGIKFSSDGSILNLDIGYLDSKGDPREVRDSYRRLTVSTRFSSNMMTSAGPLSLMACADFTGSFDNTKTDPDLSIRKIDEYKSTFRKLTFTGNADWSAGLGWLEHIHFNLSACYQSDILEQRKQVAPTHPSVAPTSLSAGVQDGHFILGEYIADYRAEGKPLNVFTKLTFSGRLNCGMITSEHKAGMEYSCDKNFGAGQIYDLMKPLSATWTSRPRKFSDIPALHSLGAFLQEQFTFDCGSVGKINFQAGVRLQTLPGLDRKYDLAHKLYLDPRLNMIWDISDTYIRPFLGGGFGITSRMPTIDYLYPQENYSDFVQLNYYDINRPEENSRINLRTYINSTLNYKLTAARNIKWEIRTGFNAGDNSLSVTFFNERLRSGFRYSAVYAPYKYDLFDASAIDAATLSGPPDLNCLPVSEMKVLEGYRSPSNGTRIDKQGIEFQFRTARWKPLSTSLTVNGAWFKSIYSNSTTLYSPVSDIIGDISVSDKYIGLYNYSDGRKNTQFNTNFMFDTQITRWGLIFTTSIQCMWFVKTRQLPKDGMPESYLSADDGQLHPYTESSITDPVLSKLVKRYNDNLFNEVTVPTALYANLKASKRIGKMLTISLFVNRLFDYLPEYKINGLVIRRNSDAYFGMEINLKI